MTLNIINNYRKFRNSAQIYRAEKPWLERRTRWVGVPVIIIMMLLTFSDNRSRADYRIPPLDRAEIAIGTMHSESNSKGRGHIEITSDSKLTKIGCYPNVQLTLCVSPEVETNYSGKNVVVKYFSMPNARYNSNILLQLEHDNVIVIDYFNRHGDLRSAERLDADSRSEIILALFIGVLFNGLVDFTQRKKK